MLQIGEFRNIPVQVGDMVYWDIENIFAEIKNGIRRARRMFGEHLASIGITSWGNDFGLLGADGNLLQRPICSYDKDHSELVRQVLSVVPKTRLYSTTASHTDGVNSLYQLLSIAQQQPDLMAAAKTFLTIPDILNYWLTGIIAADQTNASTTQMFNPGRGEWARELIQELGLSPDIFPEVKIAGSSLGPLKPDLAKELGLTHAVQVIMPGCHDTACTLAAIPHEGHNSAYLSSGSWSILGVVIRKPLVSQDAMDWDFTNECGVGGAINLLRVMRGHWALDQCRETWAKADGRMYSWENISDMALEGDPFKAVVDITNPCFCGTGNMPEILQDYCRRTGQAVPERRNDMIRIFIEGMALSFRQTVERLETLTGQRIFCLYVAGCGALDYALNMMTANALNRRVVAGPYAPTALGNLMMQMIVGGSISTLSEGKKIIKNMIISSTYDPSGQEGWDGAAKQLNMLRKTRGNS